MRATLVSFCPTQAATDANIGEVGACYSIYALCDPRNEQVRDVGITKQTVQQRLKGHLKLAREGKQLHCSNWLRQLLQDGMWQSKEYLTWIEMRARCNNPKHPRYGCNGALGVQVCPEWQTSFEQFFADMGAKPENYVLMRKNRTQDYIPFNCVWATKSELRRQVR